MRPAVRGVICGIFVVYFRLFVDCMWIVCHCWHTCMRMRPILSSQRGASAEYQRRVEAPQHVGVGPRSLHRRRQPPHRFSSHLRIQQALSRESGGPPPLGWGAPGDDLGQTQAMLNGDELTPAARCGPARRRVRSNGSGLRTQATSPDLLLPSHRCRHVQHNIVPEKEK